MPNHVKNRLEIIGSENQVNEVVSRFSTYYEKTLRKTHDESMIICSDSNGDFKGWYDEGLNEFEYANNKGVKVIGLPEGFQYEYNKAFIQMPDFNKIKECPSQLNITSGSRGDMGYSIISGESENEFMSMKEQLRRFYELDNDNRIEAIELGLQYFKNVHAYGAKTWYDWNIENWGTKWNSYSCEKESSNVFTFETARSGVPNLVKLMSKEFPQVKFIYEYSDEDTGCNCGSGFFYDGMSFFEKLESGSVEAYELAFKLRPDRKEGYQLVDGNYEYIEEE